MDWLFDNLGKFAPVVLVLLYMIGSLKGRGQKEEEAVDPEAAERARRIQEEIRRKIIERQRSDGPLVARPPDLPSVYEREEPEPEPVFRENAKSVLRRQASAKRPPMMPMRAPLGDSFTSRGEELEAKIDAAKRMQTVAKEKVETIKRTYHFRPRGGASADQVRGSLRKSLSNRTSLKTAFVLREVLDKPVGMR